MAINDGELLLLAAGSDGVIEPGRAVGPDADWHFDGGLPCEPQAVDANQGTVAALCNTARGARAADGADSSILLSRQLGSYDPPVAVEPLGEPSFGATDLVLVGGDTLVVTQDHALQVSHDAGRTWDTVRKVRTARPTAHDGRFEAIQDRVVLAILDDHLLRSTDQGDTWSEIPLV